MSAKKEVYLFVKEKINNLSEIKHFDVWNDNVNRDGEVDPFPTPAVFFEWGGSVWSPSDNGNTQMFDDITPNQHGDLDFNMHLVIKKTSKEELDELRHYDLENIIYKTLHFTSLTDCDIVEGKIQRSSESVVLRHKVWRDLPITYNAKVIEIGSTGIDDGTIIDSQPVDFDLDVSLSIKNSSDQQPKGLIINIKE